MLAYCAGKKHFRPWERAESMTKDSNNNSRSSSHVSYVPGIVLGASQMFRDPYFTEEEVGTGWLSGSQDMRQGSQSLPSSQPRTTLMVRKDEQTGRVWCARCCCWWRAGGGTRSRTGWAWLGESTDATGQWDKRLARVWCLGVLRVGTAKVGADMLWAGRAHCPGAGEPGVTLGYELVLVSCKLFPV